LIGAWALAREGETLGSLASAIENFFKGISPSQTT
jgi:hypothetical protein